MKQPSATNTSQTKQSSPASIEHSNALPTAFVSFKFQVSSLKFGEEIAVRDTRIEFGDGCDRPNYFTILATNGSWHQRAATKSELRCLGVSEAPSMNFFGTENRSEHTVAGRLIPLGEAANRSIMKAANLPVSELKYGAQLPAWCHNICDQLTKSVFRSLVDSAPKDGKFTARNWGRMAGFILRWASFCFNDAPAVLKREGFFDLSPEQEEKIEENSGIDLLFPIASEKFQKPITSQEELFEAGEAHFKKKSDEWMNQAFGMLSFFANQPISEQHKFLCGIPEGFTIVVNNEGEFTGKRKRYEIYILLAMYWPEIAEMQKSEPPKTRRDLLEWLEKQESKQLVEDEKVFFAICGDIGLDLAPPGHPKIFNSR